MSDELLMIKKGLMNGNKRFIMNKLRSKDSYDKLRRELYEKGQFPKAVVITCSDSRVVPEFIFDVELGELFVIRNAGNIVDKSVIENVEFAVSHLGARYILIMAHEKCGAVAEAVEKIKVGEKLHGFIKPMENAINNVRLKNNNILISDLASRVEEENAEEGVKKLLSSEMLSKLYREEKIAIDKAKYFLSTGEVKVLQSNNASSR
ncbi:MULTISPECIES: carbonic anhydrase [Clostridium]|uniref:carbonic anhydrase n=1 Tax=Clostridium TaxID=1485 RepID=UPI00069E6EDF|nr:MULTISPECIES: carbonic anhydrase [Clostridium]KOF56518.1 carbonic anhydrase [Clostridium sp. DMHC 10]MCD2346089.1 carbonic anhydrase [Clostridium guangxiense]